MRSPVSPQEWLRTFSAALGQLTQTLAVSATATNWHSGSDNEEAESAISEAILELRRVLGTAVRHPNNPQRALSVPRPFHSARLVAQEKETTLSVPKQLQPAGFEAQHRNENLFGDSPPSQGLFVKLMEGIPPAYDHTLEPSEDIFVPEIMDIINTIALLLVKSLPGRDPLVETSSVESIVKRHVWLSGLVRGEPRENLVKAHSDLVGLIHSLESDDDLISPGLRPSPRPEPEGQTHGAQPPPRTEASTSTHWSSRNRGSLLIVGDLPLEQPAEPGARSTDELAPTSAPPETLRPAPSSAVSPAAGGRPSPRPHARRQAESSTEAGPRLTPGSRALAAAYDLLREDKSVSVNAACRRAHVDRGNLRLRYREAFDAIKQLAQPGRAPRRGLKDRRTGEIDAYDE